MGVWRRPVAGGCGLGVRVAHGGSAPSTRTTASGSWATSAFDTSRSTMRWTMTSASSGAVR
eukprot:1898402-Lingulodinium_polyedra.AAC.1